MHEVNAEAEQSGNEEYRRGYSIQAPPARFQRCYFRGLFQDAEIDEYGKQDGHGDHEKQDLRHQEHKIAYDVACRYAVSNDVVEQIKERKHDKEATAYQKGP